MPNRILIFLIGMALVGAGCMQKDEWKSFYYPDANDLTKVIVSPSPLVSLEKCREFVEFNRKSFNPAGSTADDYECGKNCKVQDANLNLYICEEIFE